MSNNDMHLAGLDNLQTITLLGLTSLTNWSAELISSKMAKLFLVTMTPEMVWDTHNEWNESMKTEQPDKVRELAEYMGMVLKLHNIIPIHDARPLSQTPRPVSDSKHGPKHET
jgi:hypothetical protein